MEAAALDEKMRKAGKIARHGHTMLVGRAKSTYNYMLPEERRVCISVQ